MSADESYTLQQNRHSTISPPVYQPRNPGSLLWYSDAQCDLGMAEIPDFLDAQNSSLAARYFRLAQVLKEDTGKTPNQLNSNLLPLPHVLPPLLRWEEPDQVDLARKLNERYCSLIIAYKEATGRAPKPDPGPPTVPTTSDPDYDMPTTPYNPPLEYIQLGHRCPIQRYLRLARAFERETGKRPNQYDSTISDYPNVATPGDPDTPLTGDALRNSLRQQFVPLLQAYQHCTGHYPYFLAHPITDDEQFVCPRPPIPSVLSDPPESDMQSVAPVPERHLDPHPVAPALNAENSRLAARYIRLANALHMDTGKTPHEHNPNLHDLPHILPPTHIYDWSDQDELNIKLVRIYHEVLLIYVEATGIWPAFLNTLPPGATEETYLTEPPPDPTVFHRELQSEKIARICLLNPAHCRDLSKERAKWARSLAAYDPPHKDFTQKDSPPEDEKLYRSSSLPRHSERTLYPTDLRSPKPLTDWQKRNPSPRTLRDDDKAFVEQKRLWEAHLYRDINKNNLSQEYQIYDDKAYRSLNQKYGPDIYPRYAGFPGLPRRANTRKATHGARWYNAYTGPRPPYVRNSRTTNPRRHSFPPQTPSRHTPRTPRRPLRAPTHTHVTGL